MSIKHHVVVVGSRLSKGSDNKFLPMPVENVNFIDSVLAKVAPEDYAYLYHGMAAGVDTVVDTYAHTNAIWVKQFPAYWFDPTKDGNINKAAGLFRNEAMIRNAVDSVHNKEDEFITVLAFYDTETATEDRGVNHLTEYATKRGLTVRSFQLPVKANTAPTTQVAVTTSNTVMPDPFGQ